MNGFERSASFSADVTSSWPNCRRNMTAILYYLYNINLSIIKLNFRKPISASLKLFLLKFVLFFFPPSKYCRRKRCLIKTDDALFLICGRTFKTSRKNGRFYFYLFHTTRKQNAKNNNIARWRIPEHFTPESVCGLEKKNAILSKSIENKSKSKNRSSDATP